MEKNNNYGAINDFSTNHQLAQTQTFERKENGREIDSMSETELADVIYVFIPSKQLGIKFYSRSPKSALKEGIFETDIHSISKALWDEKINSEKEPTLMKTRQGDVVVCTYIVSERNFLRIIDEITKQRQNEKITINITHNELVHESTDYNNIDDEKYELEKLRDELLNSIAATNNYSNIEDKYKYEQFTGDSTNTNKIV